MADLPPAGVYGDTGIDPEPKTPILPDSQQTEQLPVGLNPESSPNPMTPVGEAIRRLLAR